MYNTRHRNNYKHDHHVIDIEVQRDIIDAHARKNHEMWVQKQAEKTRFDHETSKVRAHLLVTEAWRLEKVHLGHQHAHCKRLLAQQRGEIGSPRKMTCESQTSCACLKAPIFRQLLPKYRAMNLLQNRFDAEKLETAVDQLRRTYSSDDEMMQDLIDRYGPEGSSVDPALWLRSIEERQSKVDKKWKEIGKDVKAEMSDADRFATVIRNLSIMRIFLEGSQAPNYGCDSTERQRRDAFHNNVLEQLEMKGTLFL